MRVVFLSVSAGFGGSESALWQLVRGVRRLAPAVECVVIVPREGPLSARVRDAGGNVRVVSMPEAVASFGEWSLRGPSAVVTRAPAMLVAMSAAAPYQRALRSVLDEIEPDVIHTNGFKMHVLGSRAAPNGAAVVWHLHEFVSNRPVSRRLLRHHARRAAAIVANSRSVAEDARRALGDGVPVTHVHNAVDLHEFMPSGAIANLDALSDLPSAARGTVRVGLVATFARWKGHETFLRALSDVTAPVRAYIVGGPMYDTAGSQLSVDELRGRAAALGVGGRVGFTGFVDRPATVMRALDIVVHASTDPEPFGLVIAEGLACGKAVIVSAAGGAAELVDDGIDAITVPPGDSAALARAIDRLAADPSLRARLGDTARASAARRFDPDVFTRAFLDIYERVAPSARPVMT